VAHVSADGPGGDCWRLNARPAHPRPVKVMAIIALAFTTAPLHLVHGCPGCAAPCRHVAGPSGAAALLPASMWAVCVLAAIGAIVILILKERCVGYIKRKPVASAVYPRRGAKVCVVYVVEGNTGREGGLTRPAIETWCGPRV
jgi:hypothetical protein